jgi:hypothetical protein
LLPENALKDLLSGELADRDRLLICLAVEPLKPREVKEIKRLGLSAGWRAVSKKNISAVLSRCSSFAVRTPTGWELTAAGTQHVARIAGPLMASPVPQVASSLRAQLVKIASVDTQRFIEEAIVCFETRQYRAAVVLAWVGAVAVLQDHVVANCLSAFNSEARARDIKWKVAKSSDDLGRMKEHDFLETLESISVIGKNVKQELQKCLQLRNGCGHPNSLQVADHKVSAHIEDLILNVFAKFP